MEIEDYRKAARYTLRRTMDKLKGTGNFPPFAMLFFSDGDARPLYFPPELMNSGTAKKLLFEAVAAIAQEQHAEGVLWVTDMWTLDMKEHHKQRIREYEEREGEGSWRAFTKGRNVPDLAQEGWGDLVEAVMVNVQTPIWTYQISQFYERAGADQNHILFRGEPIEMDEAKDGHFGGRLNEMFPRPDRTQGGHKA